MNKHILLRNGEVLYEGDNWEKVEGLLPRQKEVGVIYDIYSLRVEGDIASISSLKHATYDNNLGLFGSVAGDVHIPLRHLESLIKILLREEIGGMWPSREFSDGAE